MHTPAISKILVAEDEPEVRDYLDVALRSLGFSVDLVEDGDEALARLTKSRADYSLLLMDLIMPGTDGLETLQQVRKFDSDLPVVMISGASSTANAVEAIRSGANDFLEKPVSHEDLDRSLQRALRNRRDTNTSTREVENSPIVDEHCSHPSLWTKKLDVFLKQVGSSEVPVLLLGETGVGKEVLARRIHACSRRAAKSFLKLNCAALPSELIESELFGYERGAFTGAFRSTPGKFEMAEGGTILLDEIGDMDFKLQAKLLQVLQDGEFLRLGGKEMCRVNVRVIAATHCDLEEAIIENRFREDLYYRLNVIRIEIPPLRERRDEILPLAHFFMRKHSRAGEDPVTLNATLRQALLAHSWPGNIRELENVTRKLLVVRHPDMVLEDLARAAKRAQMMIAASVHGRGLQSVPAQPSQPQTANLRDDARSEETDSIVSRRSADPGIIVNSPEKIEKASALHKVEEARKQAETEAIVNALNTTLWNRKDAAKLLNIEYKALLYRMKKLGIGENSARGRAESACG